jgi:hypothetical protein
MIDEVATEFTGDPVRFVFSSWGEGAVLEDFCLVGWRRVRRRTTGRGS